MGFPGLVNEIRRVTEGYAPDIRPRRTSSFSVARMSHKINVSAEAGTVL